MSVLQTTTAFPECLVIVPYLMGWCILSLHACVLCRFSRVWLFSTLWIVASKLPLSVGFSRQEYCSGSPCPPPEHLPDPGIEPMSPSLQVDSSPIELPGKPHIVCTSYLMLKRWHTMYLFFFYEYVLSHKLIIKYFSSETNIYLPLPDT